MSADVLTVAVDSTASVRLLDRSLVRGFTWTGGVKGLTLFLSWASTIIVARLLSPGDYGLVAMATVYLGITTMVTDFGFGSAIVALRDLSGEIAAQLHAVTVLIGISGFVISCIVAAPLSRFFRTPALIPVVIVLSTALVSDSLRTVPVAILARRLNFRAMALLDASKVLTCVILTLALAFGGAAYWALVLGNVIASLVLTVFVLTRLRQPFARPRFRQLKDSLAFSSHFLMGQLAWYGYSNADFVVAGRVLGRIPLGEYTLAWTLTSAPGEKIMAVFGQVIPTMFAAAQRDRDALRRYFFLFTEMLALLIVPSCVGLALVAPDFVPLVFGAKWAAAILPLQLLCFYMLIHIVKTPLAPVLQVTGHASFAARCGIAMLAILPVAFYIFGRRWGTFGIAGAWLTVYPLVLVPAFVKVFRTLQIRLRDYLDCMAPTLISAVVMAITVVSTRVMIAANWSLIARFVFEVAIGAAVFVLLSLTLQRRRLTVLRQFIREVRS